MAVLFPVGFVAAPEPIRVDGLRPCIPARLSAHSLLWEPPAPACIARSVSRGMNRNRSVVYCEANRGGMAGPHDDAWFVAMHGTSGPLACRF